MTESPKKKCYLCGGEIPPLKCKLFVRVTEYDRSTGCTQQVPHEICVFCEMRLHGIEL